MDGQFDLSNRFYKLVMVLIVVVAVYLAGGLFYKFASLPENSPREISVSGEGKAYVKPDIATVNLGVKTEGVKSTDVVDKNNKTVNAIIKAVKDLGVEEKDIKTTQYNLYPQYNYTELKGRIFTGYVLDQQITVKIRNFDKISDVLDKAASNGATTISDMQFTVDNPETARAEARQKAIDEARQKAQDIAKSSGLSLGKLVNISENYGGGYPQPMYGIGGAGAMDSAKSIAPQIQTGQQEVDVTVSLTYRVR